MKILYRQSAASRLLSEHGFSECCLKHLRFGQDAGVTTPKTHRHTFFELHAVTRGCQGYVVEGKPLAVHAGSFLLLPPGVMHRAAEYEEGTEKLALSFHFVPGSQSLALLTVPAALLRETSEMLSVLASVAEELRRPRYFSRALVESRLFALLVELLRACGLSEREAVGEEEPLPASLVLARQYIADNIRSPLTPHEVAAYCHLSEKQLSRLFSAHEGMTLFAYIRRARVGQIAQCLSETELCLREIAERLHFSSEYYLSAFFKQTAGMSPGAYRRMQGSTKNSQKPIDISENLCYNEAE